MRDAIRPTGTSGRRAAELLARAAPHLALALVPLVVFPWHFIRGGMVDGGDDLLSGLPMVTYAAERLLSLEVLWTPDLLLGMPLLAEPEFGALYPLKLLALPFEPVTAFTVYLLAHHVLALSGMYTYLRGLRLHPAAAMVGALAYGFTGFVIGHRGHVNMLPAVAWAPIFLHLLRRCEEEGGRWPLVAAPLAFAMVPLAGCMQLTLYLAGLTATLAAARAVAARSARPLWIFAVVMVPAGMLAAPQILPTLALTGQLALGPRTGFSDAYAASFHPALLPSLVIRTNALRSEWTAYVGVVAAASAAVAVVARRRDPLVRGWTTVALVALLLAMGRHVEPLARVAHGLPLLDIFRIPTRHAFELGLAISALAGVGLDHLLRRDGGRLPGGPLPWLAAVVAAPVGGLALARWWVAGGSSDPEVTRAVGAIGMDEALAAAAVGLVWVATASLRRRRRAALAALSLAVVVWDPAMTMRETFPRSAALPDQRALLDRAPFAGGVRFARVLSPPYPLGLDTLNHNTNLLHPGVQSLLGYPSAPMRDVAEMFDLAMDGAPIDPDDLAWSRLPGIFGVTHLVLPATACAPAPPAILSGPGAPAGEAADALCREVSPGPPVRLQPGRTSHCMLRSVADGAARLALMFRARAPRGRRTWVSIDLRCEEGDRVTTLRGEPTAVAGAAATLLAPFAIPDSAGRLCAVGLVADEAPPPPVGDAHLVLVPDGLPTAATPRMPPTPVRPARGVPRRAHPGAPGHDLGDVVMPTRPMMVTVVRDARPPRGAITAGLRWGWLDGEEAGAERTIPPEVWRFTRRVSWVASVSADAARAELYATVPPGDPPATIAGARAVDACHVRRYHPLRPLRAGLWLYRNGEALPRVYTAARILRAPDDPRAVRAILRDAERFVPGETAVVPAGARIPAVRPGRVLGAWFGQEELEVLVEARRGPALLVVNDHFAPGWRAAVGDAPAAIVRVNGLVRGVVVPPGRHRVRMWYEGDGPVRVGAGAALVGLILALAASPWLVRVRRRSTRA